MQRAKIAWWSCAKRSTELFRSIVDTAVAYAWWGKVEIVSKISSAQRQEPCSDRRLLLLAWDLPPRMSEGAHRPTSFLKYGTRLGWRISAISGPIEKSSSNSGKDLVSEIPDSVRVLRVRPPQLQPSWRWFPRVNGGFLNALATISLAAKAFKNESPKIVMASGPVFHNFVAAYYLARIFDAALVLDYRDEWSEGQPFPEILGNSDRLWEIRCMRAARAVIFASEGVRDLYISTFPFLDSCSCHVIHNGWEPDDLKAPADEEPSERVAGGKFCLSSVGTMWALTDPTQFLATLERILIRRKALKNILQLRFVGRKSNNIIEVISDFGKKYPGMVQILDEVPRSIISPYLKRSSCLLHIISKEHRRSIPGKLYYYLATSRPILDVGGACLSRNLILRLGAGVSVNADDEDGLDKALMELIKSPRSRWNGEARKKWVSAHTREVLANELFEILEQL